MAPGAVSAWHQRSVAESHQYRLESGIKWQIMARMAGNVSIS